MKIETIKTDALAMQYFSFGTGRKTFVILPGLSVKSVMDFADAVAEAYKIFADGYTVYVFDRRLDLPPVYTVKDMALDTAAAFDALGIKDACIFGASQGGMMAQIIAAERPDLVCRTVLGSTSARLDEVHYRLFEHWAQLADSGNSTELYLSFAKEIYPQSLFAEYRETLLAAAAGVTEEDMRRFAVMARGTKDLDIISLLPKIKCPVLVLGVAEDQVLGAEASEAIAARLKCPIFMYSGCGHAAYDTAPDYKEKIFSFFEAENYR